MLLSKTPFLGLCWALVCSAVAIPLNPRMGTCVDPLKRLEWRQLSSDEKKAYLDAVICLTTTDAISGIAGTVNRFDDHVAIHSSQATQNHWVGHFNIWHRYFVATYEKALREDCGYLGAQPFWDWSLDADPEDLNSTRVFESEIFSTELGFGGNGPKVEPTAEDLAIINLEGGTGGGCVQDGPFASPNFVLNYPEPGCLKRDFIPWVINKHADPKVVEEVLAQPDYPTYASVSEGVPINSELSVHTNGHFGVGGVLGTIAGTANSPGDPLFYLHHANMDRLYWLWQQRDLETRLHEVGGPITPLDYGGENVTLDFEVNIGPLAGTVTLEQLLNTEGEILCYTY
ncbi:hypothetical protein ACN47E_009451 [Coniothyrium glycines]